MFYFEGDRDCNLENIQDFEIMSNGKVQVCFGADNTVVYSPTILKAMEEYNRSFKQAIQANDSTAEHFENIAKALQLNAIEKKL